MDTNQRFATHASFGNVRTFRRDEPSVETNLPSRATGVYDSECVNKRATRPREGPAALMQDASKRPIRFTETRYQNTSRKQDLRYFLGFIISIIDLMVSRDMRVKSLNCPPAVSTSPPSNVTSSPFM